MIRVVIADDHQLVREGIRALLERAADIEVVGEADDGEQAVALVAELAPDVLVMDVTMPRLNGVEAAERLRQDETEAAVVILSMHEDDALVRRALQAGARGYVLKGSVTEELLFAVRAASRGGTYLSALASETILTEPVESEDAGDTAHGLTPREMEVLALIGEGLTNRAVASRLGVSVKTVERHRTSLMAKLDAHSIVDLVRSGIKAGLIHLDD